ncbi:MAG: hypothetical protein R3B72_50075 [Polyangiaceae bacterium]
MSAVPDPASTPVKGWPAYGLATLTGILYFLGFPGIDVWPLSLVALVPLLIAMRGQRTRRATARLAGGLQ